ncbi:MAG: taurine---2-oxoglutarate transaminase, partial [Mycobacterium sp.]|nr:taurine---2-oxoglutarate transaminase [Mycobacterium sp.]
MTGTTGPEPLPNGQDLATAIAEGARAYELDRAHVFHSWSAQAALKPMTVLAAKGSYVWDGDGNKLLDFSSQLVFSNIGHLRRLVVGASGEVGA